MTKLLKFRTGGRCGNKNIHKGKLFQAGDSSAQQLCQEGKLKLNNFVSVFYLWIQEKLGGAGSAVHTELKAG